MKTMKSSTVSKILLALVGVALALGMTFSATTGVAFADSGTPVAPRPSRTPRPTRDTSNLTQAFQAEQSALSTQQANLAHAGDAVGKIQNLISQAQAKGLDTSALESALSTFQTQLATAQTSDGNAASILSAHNGFDGSGAVTDPGAAAATVQGAHQALSDARTVLTQATSDLKNAVQAWEAANKGRVADQDLQKAYANDQAWLTKQQDNLSKANDAVAKTQDLISQAQAKGLDTSALEAALATFQAQLATAQASDGTAASVLSAHNGFDASGNVTDTTAAAQTVKDATQALKDGGDTLAQASSDLKTAVQAWVEAHKDQVQDSDLQKAFANEQNWFGIQTTNLGKANDAVAKVQDLISQAKAKGLDTSALVSALSTYQATLATAQSAHDTASTVLSAHTGFDASGSVTDQAAAAQTVKDANQSLTDAHNALVQAVTDLQNAVKQWLSQNEPNVTPVVPSSTGF